MINYKNFSFKAASSISNILTFAFKLSAFIGGLCFMFYCYRIEHLPIGISIGDSVYFILFAASFGAIYGIFLCSLISLIACLSPILYLTQKGIRLVRMKHVKGPLLEPWEFPLPNLLTVSLAIVGLFFIEVIIRKIKPDEIYQFLGMILFLALIWSVYKATLSKLAKLSKIETYNNLPMEIDSSTFSVNVVAKKKLERLAISLFGVIIFTPLMIGGISGVLLDGSMRAANVRKEHVYVMLRPPYSFLVPTQLKTQLFPDAENLTTFKDVKILFSGIGGKTVIQFSHNAKTQAIAIPNDSIIIIPR